MSRHWKPDEELARARGAGAKPRLPEGAAAGLAVVAIGCLGFALLLYHVAGPRDVFAP